MLLDNEVRIKMTKDDFEMMSNCRMEFGEDWFEQIKDGRFDDVEGHEFRYIYWFDNRLSCIMAEAFLRANLWQFHRAYDTYQDQNVLLTNYVGA